MVPLAIGSQTNGSVIRPASFCGVYGFKPTHGLIPRTGILQLSRSLDHVGLFSRSIEDLALVAETLAGYDEGDPDTRLRAHVPFREIAADEPPLEPMFAFIRTPHWQRADADAKEAIGELLEALGERVEEVELFPSAHDAWDPRAEHQQADEDARGLGSRRHAEQPPARVADRALEAGGAPERAGAGEPRRVDPPRVARRLERREVLEHPHASEVPGAEDGEQDRADEQHALVRLVSRGGAGRARRRSGA